MGAVKLLQKVFGKLVKESGFEIVRPSKNPAVTFLGLRELPIRSIIDVGANKGNFAKEALKAFPHARILCFEPLPRPYAKLEAWSKRSSHQIETFNLALGAFEGEAEMLLHTEHDYSSSMLKTTDTCEELYPFTKDQVPLKVRQATLDSVMDSLEHPLEGDIFIKLDVQGYEKYVIEGGVHTFRQAAACQLEISLDKLYENQTDFMDVITRLHDLGFNYAGNLKQVYGSDGHVAYIDAIFRRSA
jgi:FkbM family methyltransferase